MHSAESYERITTPADPVAAVLARMAKATDRDLLVELRKARAAAERQIRENEVARMKDLGIPSWQRKALLTRNREKIRSMANDFVDQNKSEFLSRARAERAKLQPGQGLGLHPKRVQPPGPAARHQPFRSRRRRRPGMS